LYGVNLKYANLEGAIGVPVMTEANLEGANLEGVNLAGANLTRAILYGDNLKGANFCDTTMPDGSKNNDDCQATQEMTLYMDWDAATSWSALSRSETWKTTRTSDEDPVYVGEVQDGVPNGQGTYTFPDGRKYVGAFKDGKFHGQGTYTFADGRAWSGLWKDGEFLGRK
jgi:hypothetical protein